MKTFTKALLLTLTLTLLCLTLSFTTFAGEAEQEEIIVGETLNPESGIAYTLVEAWANAKGADHIEVVVKTDSEHFGDDLALINVSGKKTTLRLTEDVTTTSTAIIAKNCSLTIDLSGFSLHTMHQIGIHTSATLTILSGEDGGVVENQMDYPPFSMAPDGNLVMGDNAHKVTLRSKNLFAPVDVSARASFTNVHFDGVSFDLSASPEIMVEMREGCTYDMKGATGISAFNQGFTSKNITVKDGYLLAKEEGDDAYAILAEDDCVTLTFLFEGEVAISHYKKGVTVRPPSLEKYSVTINGNHYYLATDTEVQKVAMEDATYSAHYTGGAQISANYSLNTAIDFHAYIPVTDEITHIDGVPVSKVEIAFSGGERYYMVTFPHLAPKDAHKSLKITLTVNLGGKTALVDRYVSLVGYAESAVESGLGEKVIDLILHTMDYINKTNIYFGGQSSERIEKLLQDNNFTPYVWEEKNVKEISSYDNLRGACLDLNQTPGFVFYVRADYEGEILVNGKAYREYSDPLMMDGKWVKYVVVQVPAHQMVDDLTVVCGEDTLLYNLDTYIAGRASTEAYAHAFYGYVMACKNYII